MLASAISGYAVPLGALVVSLATLIYAATGMRQKGANDLVAQLYLRIGDLEKQMEIIERHALQCEERCRKLEEKTVDIESENLRLMRKLLRLENGDH